MVAEPLAGKTWLNADRARNLAVWAGILALICVGLVIADGGPKPLIGWLAYFVFGALIAAALTASWAALGAMGRPRWLAVAVGAALALRLLTAVGLYLALPVYGYAEDDEQAGYVFYDAFARDTDAWALGRSDEPLASAFDAGARSDQYGGLLFLSAAAYRWFSAGVHRPLMIAGLAAGVSSLAVLFTWGFAAMTFGRGPAKLAAWLVALYPEFVLLSASQMREPFVIAGLALGLYGYARYRAGAFRSGALGMLAGVALALFISPPYGLVAALIIGLAWLWEGRAGGLASRWALAAIAALALGALVLVVQAWSGLANLSADSPLGLVAKWLTEGARYELSLLEQGSGWVQKLFAQTPEWAHMPMATAYGVILPFLPAALADHTGAALRQAIGIWRSLGWALVLPALIYAPLAALRQRDLRRLEAFLGVMVWIGILLASYRAGADLWDNPRYRVGLLPLQAALIGWAWFYARKAGSPWLRRSFIAVLGSMLIFFNWYAGRYFQTPRLSLEWTLVLIAVFAVGYLTAAALRDRWRREKD